MKFSVAAVAVAAVSGVSAGFSNYTTGVTYTTEVVTAVTTYCPVATEITHGGKTYTITSATTLTITDCPCTISKPVTTSKVVECKTCNQTAPAVPPPAIPTGPPPPAGTGSFTPTKPPPSVPTAGAGKAAALSGAAAIAAVAAFVL